MAKVEKLLATLRGEEPEPEPDAPPPAGGGQEVPVEAVQEAVAPLEARLAELEQRLTQASEPPPLDELPPLEEVPPMEEGAPLEAPPLPPAPPTELVLFLQTKMELIEKKLEISQQEALRANMVLREREQAQHKAQREVEDLFRGIREAQRAQNFEGALRENYSTALLRVRELEQRLALAQLRMIPAEDVLAQINDEEGRAALAGRIKEQIAELERKSAAMPEENLVESPEPPPSVSAQGDQIAPDADLPQIAVLLGRVADLERRLEEAREERDREAAARRHWEENILSALKSTRRQWQKTDGPQLLVESALETMTDSIRERDALQAEMNKVVSAIADEPEGSGEIPALRARLSEMRSRMDAVGDKLAKQMAIVSAWTARTKGEGS